MAGLDGRAPRRGGAFEALDVARRHASLRGTVDAMTLPRAADRLSDDGGDAVISWRIVGTVDDTGRPALEIAVDGSVPLVCQRCLQTFDWPIAQRTRVLLARDERELARLDEDDEREVILANAPIEALTLVEDELMLTLPFAPRCERAECAAGAMQAAPAQPAARGASFAALAELKRGGAKATKR